MRNIIPVLAFLSLTAGIAYGENPEEQKRFQAGDLSLRIKSINFAVNNEYFNPIVEGYTMLGFFLQPEIIYSPASNVSIMAGGHLLKYYGTEKFSMIRPVFSTTLRFSERTTLTLGTLTGPEMHRFFDPHFHRERLYNEYVEDGAQLTYLSEHIFTDTYISWENYISRGDSAREQFSAGESFTYTSPPVAGFIRFEVPVQIQFKHFGGQISDYSGGVDTYINSAVGLRVMFDLNEKKTSRAGLEFVQFANNMRAGDSFSGINHGRASWSRAFYLYKGFRLEGGYWYGHDFYSPNGNPIFSSVSNYKPDEVIHYRQLITTSASLKFLPASAVEFFFGVDLYYDPALNRMDQSYTLHLNFDKLIGLLPKKKGEND